jgi:hypothetical protein
MVLVFACAQQVHVSARGVVLRGVLARAEGALEGEMRCAAMVVRGPCALTENKTR